MEEKEKYCVFFDLDGTLTSINSGYALFRTAYSKGLVDKSGILKAIMLSALHKYHLTDAGNLIKAMGKWVKGTDQSVFARIAEESVEKYLLDSVYPDARNEISYHRSHNATLVLLSSAVEEICKPIACHIGIDHYICTSMESSGGTLTGLPNGAYCYGNEKRRQMEDFLAMNGSLPSAAFYYADSISDLPVLERVGNPVCINPEKKLLRAAGKAGWPVRQWKN
ncbi:MAG TPA: HAD-IB family hydrolase [Bacteroidales bacterium]|nr:HAD-IB family hydrolase [Bacteroidales bacterium]